MPINPEKFIGRKAACCKVCGGPTGERTTHYVNRLGGIACLSCFPPGSVADCLLRLEIAGGQWINADHGFHHDPAPAGDSSGSADAATVPSPVGKVATAAAKREAAHRAYLEERADHAFTADEADWGWFDPTGLVEAVDYLALVEVLKRGE